MKLTERTVKDITRRVAAECARIARTCGPEIRQSDGTTILGEADSEFIARAIEKEFSLRRLALSSDDQPQTDEMQPDTYTGGNFNGVVRGRKKL